MFCISDNDFARAELDLIAWPTTHNICRGDDMARFSVRPINKISDFEIPHELETVRSRNFCA